MKTQNWFSLDDPLGSDEGVAHVRPNVWLLSSEEVPPILFTPERVAELLGVGRGKVYTLMQRRELRSVKIGCSRRISARALSEYVSRLEDVS